MTEGRHFVELGFVMINIVSVKDCGYLGSISVVFLTGWLWTDGRTDFDLFGRSRIAQVFPRHPTSNFNSAGHAVCIQRGDKRRHWHEPRRRSSGQVFSYIFIPINKGIYVCLLFPFNRS